MVGTYSAGDFHVISGDGGTVEITDPTVARLALAAHALEILCAEVLQVEEIAEQLFVCSQRCSWLLRAATFQNDIRRFESSMPSQPVPVHRLLRRRAYCAE
jgi:hypothetical protein